MPRLPASLFHEANKAMLALAGFRIRLQGTHSSTNGANTSYTVQDAGTRRVILVHLGTGNGDIRVNYNAAATSSSFPIIPARYFSIDAEKGDTIQFWNTTASPITINYLEVD